MTRLILAAAVVMAAGAMQTAPAQAAGTAPWCAVVDFGRGDAYWDCQYASIEAQWRTIEECRRVIVAGDRGTCNMNPRYTGDATTKKPKPKN